MRLLTSGGVPVEYSHARPPIWEVVRSQAKLSACLYAGLMVVTAIGGMVAAYFNPRLLEPVHPPAMPTPVVVPANPQSPAINLIPGIRIEKVVPPTQPRREAETAPLVSSNEPVRMRLPDNNVVLIKAGDALPSQQRETAVHSEGGFNCNYQLDVHGHLLGQLCVLKPESK